MAAQSNSFVATPASWPSTASPVPYGQLAVNRHRPVSPPASRSSATSPVSFGNLLGFALLLSSVLLHRGRLLCPLGNLLSIVIVPWLRLHRGRLLPCMCSLGNLLRFVPPPRVNLFCLLRLLFSHPSVLLRRRSFSFFSHPCVLLLRRSLRDLTTMAKMDTAVVIER